MSNGHQRLDDLYKNVLWSVAARLPEAQRKPENLASLLGENLDTIIKASRGYNRFTHGLVFQYDRLTRSIVLVGFSERAKLAWDVIRARSPDLLESLEEVRGSEQGILRRMLDANSPLIAKIERNSTRVFTYTGSEGRFEEEPGTVFPGDIRQVLLLLQKRAISPESGRVKAAIESSFSLWSPFVTPMSYPAVGEHSQVHVPEVARVYYILGLSFGRPQPGVDGSTIVLGKKQMAELNALRHLSQAMGTMLALPENWRRLWSEYIETVTTEQLLPGLVATAGMFAGVRHMLLFTADLLVRAINELSGVVSQPERGRWNALLRRKAIASRTEQVSLKMNEITKLGKRLQGTVRDLRLFSLGVVDLQVGETEREELRDIVHDLVYLLGMALVEGPHETLSGARAEFLVVQRFVALPEVLPIPKRVLQLILFVVLQNAYETVKEVRDLELSGALPESGVSGVKGSIEVVADCSDRTTLVLEITDCGLGMSDEVMARLRDGPHSTKQDGTHSGLGLYMVDRLVGELDGTLEFLDRAGERGTRIRVAIPLRRGGK